MGLLLNHFVIISKVRSVSRKINRNLTLITRDCAARLNELSFVQSEYEYRIISRVYCARVAAAKESMYVIKKFRDAANILSVRCDTFKAGEDIFRDIHVRF